MNNTLTLREMSRYKNLMYQLFRFSDRYEISIQLWPEQYTVYIAKDGVDLTSFGSSDVVDTLKRSLEYLTGINKNG